MRGPFFAYLITASTMYELAYTFFAFFCELEWFI